MQFIRFFGLRDLMFEYCALGHFLGILLVIN